jgi:hypothetical protein
MNFPQWEMIHVTAIGSLENPYVVASVMAWAIILFLMSTRAASKLMLIRPLSLRAALSSIFLVVFFYLITPIAQPIVGQIIYKIIFGFNTDVSFWCGPPLLLAPGVALGGTLCALVFIQRSRPGDPMVLRKGLLLTEASVSKRCGFLVLVSSIVLLGFFVWSFLWGRQLYWVTTTLLVFGFFSLSIGTLYLTARRQKIVRIVRIGTLVVTVPIGLCLIGEGCIGLLMLAARVDELSGNHVTIPMVIYARQLLYIGLGSAIVTLTFGTLGPKV